MNSRLTRFSYNGETVVIYSGNFFSKNELIAKLKEMNFLSVDSSYEERDLICIYDIALKKENNKINILNRLKRDTEHFNQRMIKVIIYIIIIEKMKVLVIMNLLILLCFL